jgi:hypothetical protein
VAVDSVSHHAGLIRSRLRSGNFGPRYLGLTIDNPSVQELIASTKPSKAENGKTVTLVEKWVTAVREGRIIKAEGQFDTCGKGMWISNAHGAAIGAAIAQTMVIEGVAESIFYIRSQDYLRSEQPGGDREFRDKAESDIMILTSYGEEYRSENNWAGAVLDDLLASRFDKGLPTIVATSRKPPESLCGYLTSEMFWSIGIMESSSGKD